MEKPTNRNIGFTLAAVLGIAVLFAAPEAFPMALLIGLIGAIAWRNRSENPPQTQQDPDEYYQRWRDSIRRVSPSNAQTQRVADSRPVGGEKIYAHAVKAAESAGMNPDDLQVLPVDLGLMVFKADQDPVVYRNQPLPDDIDYVQPFVQLRLPSRAIGEITFEIVDCDAQVLFSRREKHTLERGRNLITPSARLPIHDAHNLRDNWQLRISADGMPIALHRFEWVESDVRRIRQHIGSDGEISNELRATIDNSRLQKLSLDELLSFQTDEEAKQARR